MPLTALQVRDKVELMRHEAHERDTRFADVLKIRTGRGQDVYPEMFPEAWPRSIVANFCDIAARDLAELIAPLPAFNCSSGTMLSDAAKKFADKRTKIVHGYLQLSKTAKAMYQGADWYVTYGMLPVMVEPDFTARMPRIRFVDPYMTYPECDRFGNVLSFTKVHTKVAHQLASEFPELASQILDDGSPYGQASPNTLLEVIHYVDADQFLVYIPARKDLILQRFENRLGEVPVRIAFRPTVDGEARGQFDDVLWIQLAKSRMAVLGLEAAEMSVQAPIALPQDVQEMTFGPNAIIRTQTPEKVRRVGLEMSPAALQTSELLENEIRVGGRYPQVRSGEQSASIITGRGIQELMGGFDTQIKAAQEVLRDTFREVIGLCFRMDEKFWGSVKKEIRGEVEGAPFTMDYAPAKDIRGDYTCDVTYGLAAGMDPNRWLVFMLQLRGDQLVSRDLVQRNLPMDVNVGQLQQQIDIEHTRDALKQAIFGLGQAVPQFAAQGMDPTQIMKPFVALVEKLQKNEPFEKAALEAFKPPQAPGQEGEGDVPPGAPGGGPGGPQQVMQSITPGQAGQGPGGRPDLMSLLAGLQSRTNSPTLQANVQRKVPAVS